MASLATFFAVLLLAAVASVANAARSSSSLHHGQPIAGTVVQVPVGTKFQLAIFEDGEEQYLYSEGEKVLKTSDPDSVGIERTIWESVPGISPRSTLYIDAFAIKNSDTGYTLLYDGEFYGQYIEGFPIAGWKLFQSLIYIYPPQFSLVYLPHSNGAIPAIFHYKPVDSSSSSSSSAAAALAARTPHHLHHPRSTSAAKSTLGQGPRIDPFAPGVPVPVGTKFQLTILEDGREQYLYSEGEKVLRTTNPDSVGTARTIWESVPGFAPGSLEYVGAFAIQNTDTGFTLRYDGKFFGEISDGLPLAGWKLYLSPLRIYPQQYYLVYLPYSGANGDVIPGTTSPSSRQSRVLWHESSKAPGRPVQLLGGPPSQGRSYKIHGPKVSVRVHTSVCSDVRPVVCIHVLPGKIHV